MNPHSTTHEECVSNISLSEQRKRLLASWVQGGVSLAALAYLLATGAAREWRLLLFLTLLGGAIGFFQARDKT